MDYDSVDGIIDQITKVKNKLVSFARKAREIDGRFKAVGKQLFELIFKLIRDSVEDQVDFTQVLKRNKRFSSLIHFSLNIWLQSFEHCFTENHGHNRASNISIVSCAFFMGFHVFFFCLGFVSRTLTNHRTVGKGRAIFFAPLYYFDLLRKSFALQRLQLSERFNGERGHPKRIQEEPYYILLYRNLYKSK